MDVCSWYSRKEPAQRFSPTSLQADRRLLVP
jgi:hypothetical protein